MNPQVVILRVVWLLFGLTVGYDLSKWVNQESYEISILLFIPAFLALMVGEFFYAKMISNRKKNNGL